MRKILLFMVMAVAAGLAAESTPPDFPTLYDTYFPIVGALMMISVAISGLVYMAGSMLMNDKVKVWAKGETVEVFYSAVILVIVTMVYSQGTTLMESFTHDIDPLGAQLVCEGSTSMLHAFKDTSGNELDTGYGLLPCHLRVAKNFMSSVFYETAGLVKRVGITHSWYTFISSFAFDFTPVGTTVFNSGATFNHAIFGFLNSKNNGLSFIFDHGVKILTVIRFQEVLINFVGIALFPVLLAAGSILRVFSVTRKLGGLLMAMALCLYFVYPVFYIIGDSVYNNVRAAQLATAGGTLTDQPAIAKLFDPDVSALPKKFGTTAAETYGVNTDASTWGPEFLTQLGFVSDTSLCDQVKANEEADMESGLGWAEGTAANYGVYGENKALGTWLADAYSMGGVNVPLLSHITGPLQLNQSFTSILVGIDALSKALFFSMFFSFLSIFATIAGIKSLSPMLGGDTEIAGLTHLI